MNVSCDTALYKIYNIELLSIKIHTLTHKYTVMEIVDIVKFVLIKSFHVCLCVCVHKFGFIHSTGCSNRNCK